MSSESGMRRRNVSRQDESDAPSPAKALDTLRKFDVYTKIDDSYLQRSQSGGAVTMVTAIILTLLFFIELSEFFSVDIVHTITVDTRLNQTLPIEIDMSFPALRCDEISVDNIDNAGESQVNLAGGLAKTPLDARGRQVQPRKPKDGECLPCLEAADDEKQKCCNTCAALKEAYMSKEIRFGTEVHRSLQCSDSVGCQVHGKVIVQKISGNVHVALGTGVNRRGKHTHEFTTQDVGQSFNTSHEIRRLSFGERTDTFSSPLEGTKRTVEQGALMFHYYLKLVPTVVEDQWGNEVYTNQYSSTDSTRNVQTKDGNLNGLPGVFIVYDFSAFLMRTSQKAKPWSYIFTSICAIIGGVFSTAALVEKVITGFMTTTV